MSGELVVLILGCLLLGVGVIGGGIEVKELKIPSLHKGPRMLAAAVGIVLIGFGLNLGHSGGLGGQPVQTAAAGSPIIAAAANATETQGQRARMIHFSIVDELGDGQVMETVEIWADGKKLGRLQVDADRNVDSLSVELAADSGSLDSKTVTFDYEATQSWIGHSQTIRLANSEVLTVRDGGWYMVLLDLDTGQVALRTSYQ